MTDSHPPPHPPVSQFVLSAPPDTVGGNLNDTDTVRQCLETATRSFHNNLPNDVRAHITDKWGIQNKMIDARQIGYVDDTNDVVAQLLDAGFSPLNITRAGLGTAPVIKHIFECNGVSPDHPHLVDTDTYPNAIAENCPHTVPEAIDELNAALATGTIEPECVDLEAVADYIDTETDTELFVRNWWNHRITFPYRDVEGDVCYLIGRATDDTDDIVYSNGVVDRSDTHVQTVADTTLGEELPLTTDELREFIVPPYFDGVYTAPDDNKHADAASLIKNTITAYAADAALPDTVDSLQEIGMTHEPNTREDLSDENATRVTVLDPPAESDSVLPDVETSSNVLSPVATGINPGTSIEFTNTTNADVTVSIVGTPSGVWWNDSTIAPGESTVKACGERGMYKFRATTSDGEADLHGVIIAFPDVHTDQRNARIEQWVGEESNFNVDMAKYVKQTVDRAWIARDVVTEPIFGCETVHENAPLVVTEGVTDAIMAHQYGFPCVAPATTNFKQHHYEKICEHAADVSAVYVVNDNEVNDAGVHGALRTAMVISNAGHDVKVGELPRSDGVEKIDVAEFLKQNGKDAFTDVLKRGVPPADHDKYDASRHDPSYRSREHGIVQADGDGAGRASGSSRDVPDDAFTGENTSALYRLELRDVIDFDSLDTSSSGNTVYRGPNPIRHHGNSTGYFVIRDHGSDGVSAKDFKIEATGDGYYYNTLTWLACRASCDCPAAEQCSCTRSVTRPMGGLSNSEVFWAWKYAKEAEHIPVPADDPVPLKAVWWVASQHTVVPDSFIPSSFDDGLRLPPTAFNDVLEIVRMEYGVDPGRSSR